MSDATSRADARRQRSFVLASVRDLGGLDRFVLWLEELTTPNGFRELALPLRVDDLGEYHVIHETGSSSVTIT